MGLNPKLIILFGPDGVGKSTHAQMINRALTVNGVKSKTIWIRGPHTLSFLLSRLLLRMGRFREDINPFGRAVRTPRIGGSRVAKQVWAFLEFVSVLPLVLIRVTLPMLMGYTIVADRYLLDTMVTTAYNIEDSEFIRGRIAQTLLWLLPRRSILFHLDADYDTLVDRRGRLVEPKEFIEFQKRCYEWLGEKTSAYYIDTSNEPIEEVSSRMIKVIQAQQE